MFKTAEIAELISEATKYRRPLVVDAETQRTIDDGLSKQRFRPEGMYSREMYEPLSQKERLRQDKAFWLEAVAKYMPRIVRHFHDLKAERTKSRLKHLRATWRRRGSTISEAACHPKNPHYAKGLCWNCYRRSLRNAYRR